MKTLWIQSSVFDLKKKKKLCRAQQLNESSSAQADTKREHFLDKDTKFENKQKKGKSDIGHQGQAICNRVALRGGRGDTLTSG